MALGAAEAKAAAVAEPAEVKDPVYVIAPTTLLLELNKLPVKKSVNNALQLCMERTDIYNPAALGIVLSLLLKEKVLPPWSFKVEIASSSSLTYPALLSHFIISRFLISRFLLSRWKLFSLICLLYQYKRSKNYIHVSLLPVASSMYCCLLCLTNMCPCCFPILRVMCRIVL